MNKKLLFVLIVYIVILTTASGVIISFINRDIQEIISEGEGNGTIAVELNEVKNLMSEGNIEGATAKCDEIISSELSEPKVAAYVALKIWGVVALNVVGLLALILYINKRILKPFEDMKDYAGEISKGNLDVSLKMDRGNFFGDFTWAFDNMRKEIVKSRNAEKTAIENNKTVVATLSHDIKTPVASIRAYAEAFEANMDSTPEKRQKYLSILMEKCDEVTRLTNDLFIHSISEMDRLEVRDESFDIISFMRKDVRELFVDVNEVDIILPNRDSLGEDEKYIINADPKRFLQIMENLKNNADKYAKTKVEISLELPSCDKGGDFSSKEHSAIIHFRDFGPGIKDEEIPFITGKFYRGKNVGDEPGSGLGLYIVKELVDKMGGKLSLINRNPGLEVIIYI
ncbi:MAG: HAMP domain-containing histidine kinase [Eubacterium sp.]|nr:HAMP domain-containing histidine kinase [Eubacterium sp.]